MLASALNDDNGCFDKIQPRDFRERDEKVCILFISAWKQLGDKLKWRELSQLPSLPFQFNKNHKVGDARHKREPWSQGSPPLSPPREWWTGCVSENKGGWSRALTCARAATFHPNNAAKTRRCVKNTPPGTAVTISLHQKEPEAACHTELTCWGRSKYPYHRHLLHVALPEFRVAHVQVCDRTCQVVVSRDDPHGEHDCRHR